MKHSKLLTKIISVILVIIMVLSGGALAVMANESSKEVFSDISDCSASIQSYIKWAAEQDIVKGYDDGTFEPDKICTRLEIVIMLWRMAGKPEPASLYSATSFKDSASLSDGSKKAVAWAVEQGVIKGYSDGSFKPKNTVTRQETVIMLWRVAGQPEAWSDSGFTDIENCSDAGKIAINWAAENGIAKGTTQEDGTKTFNPMVSCKRCHIAAFLYRFIYKYTRNATTETTVKTLYKADIENEIYSIQTPDTLEECINELEKASMEAVSKVGGHAITKAQVAYMMCDIIGEGCYPEAQLAAFGADGDAVIAYLQACVAYGYYTGAVQENAPYSYEDQNSVVLKYYYGEWRTVYKYVYYAITHYISIGACESMDAESFYVNWRPSGYMSAYRENLIYVSNPYDIYTRENGATGWYIFAENEPHTFIMDDTYVKGSIGTFLAALKIIADDDRIGYRDGVNYTYSEYLENINSSENQPGVDCGGYVNLALNLANLTSVQKIPFFSDYEASDNVMKAAGFERIDNISVDELQEGDIFVIYDTENPGERSHIGVYLSGQAGVDMCTAESVSNKDKEIGDGNGASGEGTPEVFYNRYNENVLSDVEFFVYRYTDAE